MIVGRGDIWVDRKKFVLQSIAPSCLQGSWDMKKSEQVEGNKTIKI